LLSVVQRRRDSQEIAADIIRVAGQGEKKTRLMYGSSLNLYQLNSYSRLLIEEGLLAYDPRQRLFFATERGSQFLKSFERYAETRDLLMEQSRALESILSFEKKRVEPAQGLS
jgi:predicted transcriptional regulator